LFLVLFNKLPKYQLKARPIFVSADFSKTICVSANTTQITVVITDLASD